MPESFLSVSTAALVDSVAPHRLRYAHTLSSTVRISAPLQSVRICSGRRQPVCDAYAYMCMTMRLVAALGKE